MDKKRLYRNPTNQMIAGVCSGLADYFDIDVTLIRIIFVILFFAAMNGILIYVVLWILMPIKPENPSPTQLPPNE
ncbi:MAG: PspC domain-containing protein [Anaerolineaceae bacterium]|jgi:phage shock protein C